MQFFYAFLFFAGSLPQLKFPYRTNLNPYLAVNQFNNKKKLGAKYYFLPKQITL